MKKRLFVGLDVHKASIAVAVAEPERHGEVRFVETIPNTPEALNKMITKLGSKNQRTLKVCYEAGPSGYGVYRHLTSWNVDCVVVAPCRILKSSTDRIKNDHRNAKNLARLHRAGELVPVWVPDEIHEAMRDLVRSRQAASKDLKVARQRILSFLLKYGRSYPTKNWTKRHLIWLSNQQFPHRAQTIAFQNYLNAMEQALDRRSQTEQQIQELYPEWSLAPVVRELQALRGIALIIAINLVAEVGDPARFDHPKQLMAFLGLIPGEHSSGNTKRSRGITKTGNPLVRCLLYEAAWAYVRRPKVGAYTLVNRPDVLQSSKDIAWKAQLRLSKRYRDLKSNGKKGQVAITVVARELVGFVWAIATQKLLQDCHSG